MEAWFGKELIKWYHKNKRDLPWRNQTDAYRIWLSEIILQQTQVVQGLAYYLRFTEKYPQINLLANAQEDEVMKLWQGLGYYSRARNLHAAAKDVCERFEGRFPGKYEDIRSLKGVGDYTAAAIASFAYNLPHAVVDGNVYRLLSRVFGIETPIDTTPAKKQFQQLADSLLLKNEAGTYNQAIMEFGSQYCKPVNPNCEACIFKTRCLAFNSGKVGLLPIKAKKIKTRNRYFNYVVLVDEKNNIRLNRRGENDIWQGLYEFSLIESDTELPTEQLLANTAFKTLSGANFSLLHTSKTYKHILTHQHIYARFYVVKVKRLFSRDELHTSPQSLENFAFARLTEKFLNDCVLKELF